ncbi:MAG: LacI family DNA-binding transcriptional regulator [Nocardioides sp.]
MSEPRRATLSDVAARAAVSVTTASYILNGRSEQMRISAEASIRVQAAAAELAYRPNHSARSLRTLSTATIGLISDHVASGSFASQMISGASGAARASGHVLIIGETEGDPAVESKLIEEMVDRQVDGIVYVTLTTSEFSVPSLLRQRRTVLLNCLDVDGGFGSVVPDEYAGGRAAARAVIDARRADRLFVVGQDPDPFAVAGPERLRGVTDELRAAGSHLAGVIPCAWSVVPAYEAMLRFLDNSVPPTSVVCLNDRIGMGVYQAFAERGLAIPADVAAVSFDGSDLATWLRPALTSVSIPYADLGAVAVEMLLRGTTVAKRLPMPLVPGYSI